MKLRGVGRLGSGRQKVFGAGISPLAWPLRCRFLCTHDLAGRSQQATEVLLVRNGVGERKILCVHRTSEPRTERSIVLGSGSTARPRDGAPWFL